ncbi:MAG TPA: antitoxin MazE family protein, partial [Acetobacteraceae bacterium]|nr:antitoxin MazE family protein [Acetobacteraceae bacterium]
MSSCGSTVSCRGRRPVRGRFCVWSGRGCRGTIAATPSRHGTRLLCWTPLGPDAVPSSTVRQFQPCPGDPAWFQATAMEGAMPKTARTNRSSSKVRAHRNRLREQGSRPIQIWVPDVRSPEFAAAARR